MISMEDTLRPPPSTGMPAATRRTVSNNPSEGVVRRQGDLVVYRIRQPLVAVPGRRPLVACHDRRGQWLCTRREGHRGRHGQILWEMDGRVRAVWGVRAQAGEVS